MVEGRAHYLAYPVPPIQPTTTAYLSQITFIVVIVGLVSHITTTAVQ